MATIKSYTDIEQSKKLAEILPLESADMYYFLDPTPVGNIYIPSLIIIEKHLKSRMPEYDKGDIPCWSLAALLGVLPPIEGFCPIIDLDINLIRYEGNYRDELCFNGDNLIDACVAMVEKLHELNLL